MTSKEKFYLLKGCKFVNLKTNERIECRQLVSDIEKDLEELESIKSCLADYGLDITNLREICMYYKMNSKDLEKLKKIEEIILYTKISLHIMLETKTTLQTNNIDDPTDHTMPSFIKAQAYDKIIEVLKNDK